MDNLNGEIKNIFTTFRTDLSGIRVKKLLKLVRTVQASISELEKSEEKTVEVFENGHSILVSPHTNETWAINIDNAQLVVDKSNVYDRAGNITSTPFMAPSVIQQILAA